MCRTVPTLQKQSDTHTDWERWLCTWQVLHVACRPYTADNIHNAQLADSVAMVRLATEGIVEGKVEAVLCLHLVHDVLNGSPRQFTVTQPKCGISTSVLRIMCLQWILSLSDTYAKLMVCMYVCMYGLGTGMVDYLGHWNLSIKKNYMVLLIDGHMWWVNTILRLYKRLRLWWRWALTAVELNHNFLTDDPTGCDISVVHGPINCIRQQLCTMVLR